MTKKRLPLATPIAHAADCTVGDFFQWAYSDILNNRNRGIFAEYLVASALGVAVGDVREEWAEYDVRYNGHAIEVKCSAYLQAWAQKTLSTQRFDVAAKRAFIPNSNSYSETSERLADIFVFCLFIADNHESANVLDARQWHFYVVPTHTLNTRFVSHKSLSLLTLQRIATPVTYDRLKEAVDAASLGPPSTPFE